MRASTLQDVRQILARAIGGYLDQKKEVRQLKKMNRNRFGM